MEKYNQYMGGVDKADRLSQGRYALDKRFITQKWCNKLLAGMFRFALTNAYILWLNYSEMANSKLKSGRSRHFTFMWQLMTEMLQFDQAEYLERMDALKLHASGANPRPEMAISFKSPSILEHDMVKHPENKSGRCCVCAIKVIMLDKGQHSVSPVKQHTSKKHSTRYWCPGCEESVHPECFLK
jgi:hypothetical protein